MGRADNRGRAAGLSAARLPNLLDCARVMQETGVTRSVAESIMRKLPNIELAPAGIRKVYVRRDDLHAFLEKHTTTKVAS